MNNQKKHFILILSILVLFVGNEVNGQVFKRREARNESAPKFVLVQLNTYSNRIQVYEKAKNTSYATQTKTDGQEMRKRIVADFTDNFSYSKFYFYYDTNATLIKERKFDNILLDNKLQPIPANTIAQSDTNYRILIWGISNSTSQNNNTNDPFDGTTTMSTPTFKYSILNPDFSNVKHPEPNGMLVVRAGKLKQRNSYYKFASPKFNIYYKPKAKQVSDAMEDFFKR